MNDKELLEMAAKAADIRIDKSETNGGGIGNDGFCITGDAMLDWHNNIRWNPLKDDGEALRLAVKLRISLIHEQEYMGGPVMETLEAIGQPRSDGSRICMTECLNYQGVDEMDATRRAIVRAAAKIGKSME